MSIPNRQLLRSGENGTADQVLNAYRAHLSRGRVLLFTLMGLDVSEASAEGAWVTVTSGRSYLDLGSYAVFLLGHQHPAIVAAVAEQLGVLSGSTRAFPEPALARAATALVSLAPAGMCKTMLLNSGAEAAEAAIKLVRVVTGRTALVHLAASFHGKTAGALSLTDSPELHRGVGPLLTDVVRVSRDDGPAAAATIKKARPAAVFAEPVQGEGGIFPLDPVYAAALRRACDEVGALLVFDEIQCGLGRCGTLWAHEFLGVQPDVLLVGKALGGGVLPVSALIATEAAFTPFDRDPLLHTSTFGGNPLSAAAAHAALTVITTDAVPNRCTSIGNALRTELELAVASAPDLFERVTGRGAMLGLHCRTPTVSTQLLRALATERVLATPCLTTPRVLRFTPPAYLRMSDVAFTGRALNAAAVRARRALP